MIGYDNPKAQVPIVGVYQIRQLSTGKRYVGQSVAIQRRLYNHIYELNRGTHHCALLQEAWNSSKKEDFEHSILEVVSDISLLDSVEQKHMDMTPKDELFNSQPYAGTPLGFRHTEETKSKQSEIARKRNLEPFYNEMIRERAKDQHSEGKLGYNTWSEETRKKFSENRKRQILTREFPDDEYKEQKMKIQKNIKAFYHKWVEYGSLGYKAHARKIGLPHQVTRPFITAFKKGEFLLF